MATLNSPRLLLLDEHTAALDPKTAAKVLDITDKIVEEKRLTTIMITHNMKDALNHGNRLVMMNEGKIIADVRGEEKTPPYGGRPYADVFAKRNGERQSGAGVKSAAGADCL